MSYIATSKLVSIVPDSCHCHAVPGIGCHAPCGPPSGKAIAPSGLAASGAPVVAPDPPHAAHRLTIATPRMGSSYNRAVRRIVIICVLAGACGRSGPGLTGQTDAWLPACKDAFARAREQPSWQR